MVNSRLTPQEQLTLDAYAKIAPEWVAEHATRGFWAKDIALFRKYLPKGRVLEIGSGGGRDAKELIELGYDYIGIDVSEELLKEARKQVPQGTFLHQSVYDPDSPENYFDGFWASAVLLHLPKSRINEALAKIYFVTRDQGVGFISLKQGQGEKVIEEETQGGQKYKRFFAFYREGEFNNLLINNGFKVLEFQIRSASPKTTWLTYIVQTSKLYTN